MTRWKILDPRTASKVRSADCVYVIFTSGSPRYVGKTGSLYMRLHKHRNAATGTGLDFMDVNSIVKYSVDRRYGESATREIRLIAKLNPPLNKGHRLSPWEMDEKPWLQRGAA